MTAVIYIQKYNIVQSVADDADALKFAQLLREEFPTLDVVVEIASADEIPAFLRRTEKKETAS